MLLSLAFSILMILVVLIDSLEHSETTGFLQELNRPNFQLARALTSQETSDAAVPRDCSSNMMPTRLDKVRARRGDSCAFSEGGPVLPDSKTPENTHRETMPWRIPAPFRIPVYDPIFNGKNPLCVIHTGGRLPLAICDSGDINQRYESDKDRFAYSIESFYQISTFRLEYCTLGTCRLLRQKSQVTNSPARSTTNIHYLLTSSFCSLVLQII